MNINGLSFNALPPIDIPFRFFITAVCFVLCSTLVLFFHHEEIWLSRWHPLTIMFTHGFTLGFITTVMMGAIYQLLPVIGGVGVNNVANCGKISHLLHTFGSAALMLGFLLSSTEFMIAAMILLALNFGFYIITISLVLVKKLSQGPTIIGIRLAVAALVVTVIMGILLVTRMLGIELISSDKALTNIHLLWGLGWVSLLIMSVSFQVVPMFHVAPNFNKQVMRLIPLGIFLSLCILLLIEKSALNIELITGVILVLHCLYAINLLSILQKRKRKIPDTSIQFWQLAAFSLFVISLLFFIPQSMLPNLLQSQFALLLGTGYIFFFATSIILAMLLKIMPFLSYTHLQQRCLMNFSAMAFLPNMHEFISKQQGKLLYVFHLISCGLLLTTLCYLPISIISLLFALSLLIEFSWLLYLMIKTCLIYRKSYQKILTTR